MPLPIHIASSTGNKQLLRRLIESNAPQVLEVKNEHGKTPLMLSVLRNSCECTNILLKAGVHVDNCDTVGQSALHMAISRGFHRCVKLLLLHNASYQLKDFSGITSLHLAAINPNTKCLHAVLKVIKPGETDIQDSSKKTALHWSSAYDNSEHIKVLLLKGANICIPDDQGKTPLHWAATNPCKNSLECVKILLEKEGSLINWQDYEGRSALHLAVATGNSDVVRFLLSKEPCNTDILDNVFCTPLHWAARKGLFDKVDILLNKSLHTSADDNGATPLHYAAYFNQTKTIEMFLSRKFISDLGDASGRNALMWAAAMGADDAVLTLAKSGTDLQYADKSGFSALHIAALHGHLSTIQLIVQLSCPIDLKDKGGLTPLLRASQFGRAKASQLLMDLGADVTVTDLDYRTVLHWCAIEGHAYLCQLLLNRGVSLDDQDVLGRTPLHYACMKSGFLNCVSVLLESDANPNIADKEGKLPLHWAILANHSEIVRLLCDYDTDVNALFFDSEWISPLDLAILKKNPNILKLLKKNGALTFHEIKEMAAQRIQKWYRSNRFLNQILILNKKLNISCQTSFKENCFISEECNDIMTTDVSYEDNVNQVLSINFKYNKDAPRAKECKDKAKHSAVIQRAWKRYQMKMKFLRMRQTIQNAFKTIDLREKAEIDWHIKMQSFIEDYQQY